jgi:hypothetical protein
VARRVNRAECKRVKLLKDIIGDSGRVELLYLVWLGLVARGQRFTSSRERFPQIARIVQELFPHGKPRRRNALSGRGF